MKKEEPEQNEQKSEGEKEEMEGNFSYANLLRIIKVYALMDLDKFTGAELQKLDNNKNFGQIINEIKPTFEMARQDYYMYIEKNIQKIVDKYDLKNKLAIRSEAIVLKECCENLGIPLNVIIQNKMVGESIDGKDYLTKEFIMHYLENKNNILKQKIINKKKELESLQKEINEEYNYIFGN